MNFPYLFDWRVTPKSWRRFVHGPLLRSRVLLVQSYREGVRREATGPVQLLLPKNSIDGCFFFFFAGERLSSRLKVEVFELGKT